MRSLFSLSLVLILLGFHAQGQYQKAVIATDAASLHRADIHPVMSSLRVETGALSSCTDKSLPDWNQSLYGFAKIHNLPDNIRLEIAEKTARKIEDAQSFYPDESENSPLGNPILGVNFAANIFGGVTPPDNSMAISNGGIIVSVVNSNVQYYTTGGTNTYSSSFANFFNDPTLTGMLYDPVVLYDSGSDRFFMVVLHSSSSSTSKVVVCFSKTHDPNDRWWYYKLTGNPLGNGCWFDYPKIGVSNNEVYVTGNLYFDNNSYHQSVIYQMTKSQGYSGSSLDWVYWYNISNSPFTMVPASWGQSGNYGPGIYLISSSENSSSDKIYLFDLTDDLTGSPNLNVYSVDGTFSLGGNAMQKGTSVVLNTDDTRGLSAFYLNGIVHFVFHSERTDNYYGVNYNRLTVSPLSSWHVNFGLDGYDYTYPSVASAGTNSSDKSVMVSFSRSSSGIYPECRVVYFDDAGTNSGSTQLKAGETYVDVYQSSNVTRWGDYSGIARKQNSSSPQVWLSGCYGAYQSGKHALNTWIGQVIGITTGTGPGPASEEIKALVYPNPVYDLFSIEFTMDAKRRVEIVLTDVRGSLVKILMNDAAKEGRNIFTFNKGALSAGIYFLQVRTDKNCIANEKIVIQ